MNAVLRSRAFVVSFFSFSSWLRRSLGALAGLGVLLLMQAPAMADYPDRTIRFVVGFPAGGSPDIFLRHFTHRLSSLAGQTVVVENKPGANAMVAAQNVATAKPDGYTVLFAPDSTPIGNRFLFKTLNYNPEKDLVLVAPMVWNTFVLVTSPGKTPGKSVDDLTKALKQKDGRSFFGQTSSGAQLMSESYKAMAGIKAAPVAFKGTVDGLTALMAGEIDFLFADVGAALPHIKSGKINALAVSSKRRPVLLPDVPTMAEAGFSDFDLDGFFGAYVPADTPKDVQDKLHGWLSQLNDNQEIKSAIGVVGAETFPRMTLKENQALLTGRRDIWARLIKLTNIQPQ